MPIRYIARRMEQFFIYRVLHVDDTPHRIALSLAIGIFVTWTPTMPFQMILVVTLSTLLGANKLVGLPFVWISNVATLLPIYGPSYWLGGLILGRQTDWSKFFETIQLASGWGQWLRGVWGAFGQVLLEVAVGSIPIALTLGTVTYFLTYRAVVTYRRIRDHHRDAKLRRLAGSAESPDQADGDVQH